MRPVPYQLSRPFAFAWIKADGLNWFRLYLPAMITAISGLGYLGARLAGIAIDAPKLFVGISAIFATLPGFYIAALAAVASFQSPRLDETIEGSGAEIKFMSRGTLSVVKITYRVYLCMLFAYLTALSATIALTAVVIQSITLPEASYDLWYIPRIIMYVVGYFLQSNLIVVTLHGLYFLAERMHRPSA